ncbi:SHOCT domain-containing protein [Flavobacterium yafengii]|uniref:SHOCT domain-containing protein n=1 Tax=Flavobacterium yafengii TaxID=3041253 RepID=A0AAW6TQ11_9FLAO|nr:SHOCT domain-containing protein [Flavobacterium yafengii]MDI5950551.1 SHOCT domain-containing protein [Flavobacterium yafengii]
MEHSIGVGAIVGLVFASSIYVWNNDRFSSTQKTILLICIIFPPAQWLGILIISVYNSNIENNTPERKTEKKLESTISNLTELKSKGILSNEEYNSKVKKIKVEKTEQNLKNSLEYKQLKSLFDSGILTKEEFENKIQLLQKISEKEVNTKEINKKIDSTNKTYFEVVEEKKESLIPIYIGSILFFALVSWGIMLYSNKTTSNSEDIFTPPAIDTSTNYNTNSNNTNYQEAQKEEEKIFVYGTVDYKYFELEYFENSSYPALKKEGKTCSPVFEIKKEELAKFKQKFYSSVDVQHYNHSNSSLEYGYFTYPETVEVLTFVTMDEANEYQMNNCDKTLSTFFYF